MRWRNHLQVFEVLVTGLRFMITSTCCRHYSLSLLIVWFLISPQLVPSYLQVTSHPGRCSLKQVKFSSPALSCSCSIAQPRLNYCLLIKFRNVLLQVEEEGPWVRIITVGQPAQKSKQTGDAGGAWSTLIWTWHSQEFFGTRHRREMYKTFTENK